MNIQSLAPSAQICSYIHSHNDNDLVKGPNIKAVDWIQLNAGSEAAFCITVCVCELPHPASLISITYR